MSFFKKEEELNKTILASEEELTKLLAASEDIDKKTYKLIENKELLDKEYKSLLLKEEISQQKGGEEVPEAA